MRGFETYLQMNKISVTLFSLALIGFAISIYAIIEQAKTGVVS
ncbi:hypothetical protein [Vibrio gigantis]